MSCHLWGRGGVEAGNTQRAALQAMAVDFHHVFAAAVTGGGATEHPGQLWRRLLKHRMYLVIECRLPCINHGSRGLSNIICRAKSRFSLYGRTRVGAGEKTSAGMLSDRSSLCCSAMDAKNIAGLIPKLHSFILILYADVTIFPTHVLMDVLVT